MKKQVELFSYYLQRSLGQWRASQGFMIYLLLLGVGLLGFLFFPITTQASPPAQEGEVKAFRQSLIDLGYTSDIILEGLHVETTFTFPLPEGGIKEGLLTFDLTPSPLLLDESSVQIYLNEQPVAGKTIEQLRLSNVLTVTVPTIERNFLSVRIEGNLSMTNNQCVDENSQNLWLTISRHSNLSYTYSDVQDSIRAFLRLPGGRVIVHGLWESPDQQAASISLFSALNYFYRDSPTIVVLAERKPTSLPRGPEETVLDRDVYLVTDIDAPPLRREGDALYIAATSLAINELLSQVGQPLLLGQEVQSLQTVPHPSEEDYADPLRADERLDLVELRVGNQERVGIGELPVSIRFTRAQLGGWPSNFNFHLEAVFDPIPTDTLERAYLRVALNGTALETFDIRGTSVLQRDIPLPEHLLEVQNIIEVTFIYAPESGNCLGSPYTFTGQVSNSSALVWSGYEEARALFPETISFSDKGALYLLETSPEAGQATALLLGGLNRYTNDPLLPVLADNSTLDETVTTDYRIVVGDSNATQALDLPIYVERRFDVLNPQRGNELVLRGVPDEPLVALQYLADTQTLVLQTNSSADDVTILNMIERLIDPERFFQLNGDVIVSDGRELVALNLTDSTLVVTQPELRDWMYWLMQYRWVVMVIAAVLLIALWWTIYNRVGRRQPVPVAPQ